MLPRYISQLSDADARLADEVQRRFEEARFQPPTASELASALKKKEAEVARAIEHLVDAGKVGHVGAELYAAKAVLDDRWPLHKPNKIYPVKAGDYASFHGLIKMLYGRGLGKRIEGLKALLRK